MNPTLRSVVTQINKVHTDQWSLDDFCGMVNAHDNCNAHLALPTDLGHFERTDAVSADLVVYGEIFSLTWNAHWPRLDLHVHDDKRSLADHAETWLGRANGFWAFCNGRLTPCRVVHSGSVDGYDVYQAVAGKHIAVKNV
jgi:hypothetical protein